MRLLFFIKLSRLLKIIEKLSVFNCVSKLKHEMFFYILLRLEKECAKI